MQRGGSTELHYYAALSRYVDVECLLNEGVDPNVKDSCGRTPLIVALEEFHLDVSNIRVVELLIQSGADIHCRDINGYTALHHASYVGLVEIVKCLINKGADFDGQSCNGKTPLMSAARWSQREVVELLINSGADIHVCDDYGWTLLHHVSSAGWIEIVQHLVNKGVALDSKNCNDQTPLMLAAEESQREIVEQLIKSGANIRSSDINGWTLLHYVSYNGWLEIVHYLLNEGVAINVKDDYGKTPLMVAARWSRREIFELLSNSGADIYCCDNDGRTVLHFASLGGSVEIIQCLVNKGVAVDVKNSFGGCSRLLVESPLMVAARESERGVVELLINLGADVHCRDKNGWTVLHHASGKGSVEIIHCLLNEGVELDTKNSNGETPLHLAVKRDGIEIADCLLKAGADCNLEDSKGESPFNFLVEEKRHQTETIKLCIKNGAYVKTKDNNTFLKDPLLKNVILQDVELCSLAFINKFNNKDLPLLYKQLASAQDLPRIDKMKIGNGSGMALEVERAVTREIQAKGLCNLLEMFPFVLSVLCVKNAIEKPRLAFDADSLSNSQNGSKRL